MITSISFRIQHNKSYKNPDFVNPRAYEERTAGDLFRLLVEQRKFLETASLLVCALNANPFLDIVQIEKLFIAHIGFEPSIKYETTKKITISFNGLTVHTDYNLNPTLTGWEAVRFDSKAWPKEYDGMVEHLDNDADPITHVLMSKNKLIIVRHKSGFYSTSALHKQAYGKFNECVKLIESELGPIEG